MRLPMTVVCAAAMSAMLAGQAPTIPAAALLVLSKTELTLSTVDPTTLQVLSRVPSGPDPHEVIASEDGRTAYVANYGGGSLNTITAIDLVNQKPLKTINLGALRGPHGLVFVASKLWFTAEGAKVVGSYDPASDQVDLVIGTGQNRTHMIHVMPDARRIITSNVSSATMTIIDRTAGGRGGGPGGPPAGGPGGAPGGPGGQPPGGAGPGASQGAPAGGPAGRGAAPPAGAPGPGRGGAGQGDWDETHIAVGRGAEGFDVSADGTTLWAANALDGTISIVDLTARKVTDTLAAKVEGANRLKFTPDGKLAFVSTLRGPDVTVFDVATRREVKRITVGRGAAGIQMQPDGARVFVACTPDDNVAVINLKTMTVTGRIDAGKQPDGMAWAARR